MGRAILMVCVPWLGWLMVSLAVLFLLVRVSRAKLDLGRLRQLHADQHGSAQSLSFVLALPLFIMILLFIVQVSQLMIGAIVVQYAAYAAARSAIVWIPANLASESGDVEPWNRVFGYSIDGDADNQAPSLLGPTEGGMNYKLAHAGGKYEKIRMAAALACLPISPSRSFGFTCDDAKTLDSLGKTYTAITGGTMFTKRLGNKLAYALFQNPSDPSKDTLTVDVRFYHSNRELPLCVPVVGINELPGIPPDRSEFLPGQEVGWQDAITVTVKYNLALLPGPGRLLATRQGRAAPVAGIGGQQGNPTNVYTDVYTYPLSASATLGNEGEKPAYAHYNLP